MQRFRAVFNILQKKQKQRKSAIIIIQTNFADIRIVCSFIFMVTPHVSVQRRATNEGSGTEAAGVGSPSLMLRGDVVPQLDGVHELGWAPVTFVLVVLHPKVLHLQKRKLMKLTVYMCVCLCECVRAHW